MKRLVVLLALVLAALVTAQSAAAHGDHASCKGYGQETALEAQAGILVGIIQSVPPGERGQGLAFVHSLFCEPR